jgi:hypothetical protein
MFRRAIFSSLVVIAAGFSGCTYHMQCGTGGCAAMAGADACAGCGDVACAGRCGMGRGFGPLGFARYMGTCGAGCGGMYFNEWIADPPDACDPCDDCGNFIGRQCCMPRFRRWAVAARSMWGFRYDGRCGSCGGNCGGGCAHAGDLIEDGGTIYHGPSHSSNGTNGGSG